MNQDIYYGENFYLRLLTPNDVTENYINLFKNEKMLRFYSGSGKKFNKQYLISEIEYNAKSKELFIYGIYKYDHTIVGNIKIGPILKHQNISDLIIYIGDSQHLGKNNGSKIIRLATNIGFHKYKIRKYFSGIYSKNIPAIKAYTSGGWIKTSVLKDYYVFNNRLIDKINVECSQSKIIDNVIFNLEILFHNFKKISKKIYIEFMKEYQITPCHDEFEKLYGIPTNLIINYLIKTYDINDNNLLAIEKYNKISSTNFTQLEINSNYKNIFKVLLQKKIKITILSNCFKKIMQPIIKEYDLNQYISNYIFNDDLKNNYNTNNLYLSTLIKYNFELSTTLTIENNLNGTYDSAHTGIKTLTVNNQDENLNYEKNGAYLTYNSLQDCMDYIEKNYNLL